MWPGWCQVAAGVSVILVQPHQPWGGTSQWRNSVLKISPCTSVHKYSFLRLVPVLKRRMPQVVKRSRACPPRWLTAWRSSYFVKGLFARKSNTIFIALVKITHMIVLLISIDVDQVSGWRPCWGICWSAMVFHSSTIFWSHWWKASTILWSLC